MKKSIDLVSQSVTFTFGEGLAPITLAMADVSPVNATRAMLHGFSQRLGDNAAIAKSAENGYTVTEAMRRTEVEALANHYRSGTEEWNVRVSERKVVQNPVFAAIAAKFGCTYEEAMAKVQATMLGELTA